MEKIIALICFVLLLSYLFELSRIKIPSVIFLILLGVVLREISKIFHFDIPNLFPLLSAVGTVGLILIILESALELKIDPSKKQVITRTSLGAFLSLLVLSFGLGILFKILSDQSLRDCIINAIPFAVISSAIAIPSTYDLRQEKREYVIYESSFSDIIGILIFNFFVSNQDFGLSSFLKFGLRIIGIIPVSLLSTFLILVLISKIEHHIRFIPIILFIVLVYSASKVLHLPSLLFVLFFGIFLENIDIFRFAWLEKFKPIREDIDRFKDMIFESTFLVRSIFFLVFGYIIEIRNFINLKIFALSVFTIIFIFTVRWIQLKIMKLPTVLLIAPRGLITILLFLNIPNKLPFVNNSYVIQVIVLSILIMFWGLLREEKHSEVVRG